MNSTLVESTGALSPLRVPIYRRVWSSSLVSNFGHLILGVAAAWEMTRLSNSSMMVAMVQTALMLPLMLVALPAGAFADMFDKRKVALAGLFIACAGGCVLTAVGLAGLITPWLLLGLLCLSGSGVALYGPAWQSSIGELVPPRQLPAAVALGSVAYNLARSFGPAVGGVLVLAAGAHFAFGVNALGYLPLILAFLFWKREQGSSRLPPESLSRALVSGFRYMRHAAGVRNSVIRAFLFGLAGATATALAPLFARDQLAGTAGTYGVLLGASGLGAVAGSLATSYLREKVGPENTVRAATLATAFSLLGIALSMSIPLTALMYAVQGAGMMLVFSMLNIGVQLSAPRWVMARALSLYSSSLTGGVAIGSLAWGALADSVGIQTAMFSSGIAMGISALTGFILPLKKEAGGEATVIPLANQLDVKLGVTARSGPVVIEVDYRVDPADARPFYQAMQAVGKARRRNGGFTWTLSRDIADPALWTERYICPTWGDYLHLRDRYSQSDMDTRNAAEAFNSLHDDSRIRRRLERPYGSVRRREETPDLGLRDGLDLFTP